MNELYIKFNQETHKLKYMGIAKPAENCEKCELSKIGACNPLKNECEYGSIITNIYGKFDSIIIPIPDEEEEKKQQNRGNKT